jgi:lipopolysaccharide export system protein LptA
MWKESFLKTFVCKLNKKRLPLFYAALFFWLCFTASAAADTDTPQPAQTAAAENRIHITADELITNTNERIVEFIGHVKAIQGTTVLTSNRLKVFYKASPQPQQQLKAQSDSISRIVAQGNVRIVFDNQVAEAEQADYVAAEKIIILTGKETKITSGNNSISGTKITLYRGEGKIQVESNKDKRVEAFFYSQEDTLGISSGTSAP